jgi:hypothetical protein
MSCATLFRARNDLPNFFAMDLPQAVKRHAEMAGGVEHNRPGFDTRTHAEAKLLIVPDEPDGGS